MPIPTIFPMNVVGVLQEEFVAAGISGDQIYLRPLRPSDPHSSIGLFPQDWVPNEDSAEMMGGLQEPTISRYLVGIHTLVKNTDEADGILQHAILSKSVRSMLYRASGVRVRLPQLNETSLGITERLQRWGVRQQRYLSNEIEGSFVFVSVTDIWVETEAVPSP